MRDDRAVEVESTELLRTLIRNACVNDGSAASGQEDRNVRRARGRTSRAPGLALRALRRRCPGA